MKSHSLITVLKFGKTIVETIIPCFLLLISQKLKIAFFENIYMQTFMKIAEAQNENTSLYDYLIQIFILLCLTVTFFNLFLVSSQKIKVYTLYTLTVFSFLWGLFNLIEVNIFYRSLLMNESATGIKLFCMVNIFLAFILSILYKIISHSDALILSNFLCCRFGVLEILGYVACKIINTFIIS